MCCSLTLLTFSISWAASTCLSSSLEVVPNHVVNFFSSFSNLVSSSVAAVRCLTLDSHVFWTWGRQQWVYYTTHLRFIFILNIADKITKKIRKLSVHHNSVDTHCNMYAKVKIITFIKRRGFVQIVLVSWLCNFIET